MKAKTLKKTIAAVMALAFLSGAASVVNGGTALFDTAMIANAEEEKTYTFTYDDETKEAVISGVLPQTGYSVSELMAKQFDVKKVVFKEGTVLSEDCNHMFNTFTNLETVDFRGADLSKVKNTEYMFTCCRKLENVYFTDTDLSAVTSMSYMFDECFSLRNVNLSASSPALTNVSSLFRSCRSLTDVDLRYVNTENVTDFSYMFYFCHSLESIDLSNIRTGNAVSMKSMFDNCTSLTKLDLRSFNTSNAEDMSSMFEGCVSLVSIDVNSFDTRKVKKLDNMFSCCFLLEKLDLSNFDTSAAESLGAMFGSCYSLRDLDISRFNTIDKSGADHMFGNNYSLRKVKVGFGVDKLWLSSYYTSKYGWVNENAPDTDVSSIESGYAVIENHGENTYIKNQCKGFINGIGVNINTDGTIGFRVAVSLPDDLTEEEMASAQVEFYPDGAEGYEVVPVKRGKDGNYYAVHSILSKGMTDQYFINLMIGEEKVDSAYQSVRQYASKILTAPETYPDEQDLVKTMLLYGGAAQRQFNYNVAGPNMQYRAYKEADHGITYTGGGLDYERQFFGPKGAGVAMGDVRYAGSSIVLGSGVVQRHYFTVNSEKLDQYTFEVDGKIVTPTNKSADLYYVDAVKNSSMMALDVPSKINVRNNNDSGEKMTLDYSVMDYVVTLRGTVAADSTEYAVVENLSRLAKEAKEYFNK